MSFEYIRKISDEIGIQMVKYFDETSGNWEEGMLCELILKKRNMWKVYFPATFIKEGYFLAIEVKDGEPRKDYCAHRIGMIS